MTTARAQSRRMFADAIAATNTSELLALAIQYTNALVSDYATDPALRADTAADLAAVAGEIERRNSR